LGNNRAVNWLKVSFLTGAIIDALVLIPMAVPAAAKILWGFNDFSGIYYFAMGMGASLMSGWTILLLWAYRKPLERRYIALFTVVVVTGFVLMEIFLANQGYLPISNKYWGAMVMQLILLSLFGYSFFISGKTRKS
jgi:hypothetical protein